MSIKLNSAVDFIREKGSPLSFVVVPERVPFEDHHRHSCWQHCPSSLYRILVEDFQVVTIDVPTRLIEYFNSITNI